MVHSDFRLPDDGRKWFEKCRQRHIVLNAIKNLDPSGACFNIKASVHSVRKEAARLGLDVSIDTIKRRMTELRQLGYLRSLGLRWNGRAAPRRRAISVAGAPSLKPTDSRPIGANLHHQTDVSNANLHHNNSRELIQNQNHPPQIPRDDSSRSFQADRNPKSNPADQENAKNQGAARPRAAEPNPAALREARLVRCMRQAVPMIEQIFNVSRQTAEAFVRRIADRIPPDTAVQHPRYFVTAADNDCKRLADDERRRTDWEIEQRRAAEAEPRARHQARGTPWEPQPRPKPPKMPTPEPKPPLTPQEAAEFIRNEILDK